MKKLIVSIGLILTSLSALADDISDLEIEVSKGNPNAMLDLGLYYLNGSGGVTQDYAKAMEYYALAAKQGDKKGAYNVGLLYLNGLGVEQDPTKAKEYFTIAADKGLIQAQFNLAKLYQDGNGVKQDYAMAKKYFGLVCEQDVEVACNEYKNLEKNGY